MTSTPISPIETEQSIERVREQERINELLSEFSEQVDTSTWQNLSINAGGFLMATIPLAQINENNFPINRNHSAAIAKQMAEQSEATGGTGQIDPIDLVTVKGETGLEITDGFHRTDGLTQNGASVVHAILRANITREELIDMRIAATRKFGLELPRTVDMAQESWASTPWAEKLTVLQAFKMEATKQEGRAYKLTTIERADISAWMEDKKAKWSLTPEEVYQYLLSVGEHDREITALMRELGPKKNLGFTPKIANRIVPKFQMRFGDETITDIDMITLVAETVNRMLLDNKESLALANMVYDAANYDSAYDLVASLTVADIQNTVKTKHETNPGHGKRHDKTPSSTQDPNPEPIKPQDAKPSEQLPEKSVVGRTVEEVVQLTPNDELLDVLSRAITAIRIRKNQGDVLDNAFNASRLRQLGNTLIDMAGDNPEVWGTHQGPYKNNQAVHEAIGGIFDYIMLGGDRKPKLPGMPSNQSSRIVGEIGKLLKGKENLTESQRERVLDFKREWTRRFPSQVD